MTKNRDCTTPNTCPPWCHDKGHDEGREPLHESVLLTVSTREYHALLGTAPCMNACIVMEPTSDVPGVRLDGWVDTFREGEWWLGDDGTPVGRVDTVLTLDEAGQLAAALPESGTHDPDVPEGLPIRAALPPELVQVGGWIAGYIDDDEAAHLRRMLVELLDLART